jgi:hypothetical protein
LDNVDWTREKDGSLSRTQRLPNGITFGSSLRPTHDYVDMDLWVENGTSEKLTGLQTMVCVMLKGARGFNSQTSDNKVLKNPVAAVKSTSNEKWILTAWDRCFMTWDNPAVPCMHANPKLPDCAPGETVKVKGRIWFHEGTDIADEIAKAKKTYAGLPESEIVIPPPPGSPPPPAGGPQPAVSSQR